MNTRSRRSMLFKTLIGLLFISILVISMSVTVFAAQNYTGTHFTLRNATGAKCLNIHSNQGAVQGKRISIWNYEGNSQDQRWNLYNYIDGQVIYAEQTFGTSNLVVNKSTNQNRAILWNLAEGYRDSVLSFNTRTGVFTLLKGTGAGLHLRPTGNSNGNYCYFGGSNSYTGWYIAPELR